MLIISYIIIVTTYLNNTYLVLHYIILAKRYFTTFPQAHEIDTYLYLRVNEKEVQEHTNTLLLFINILNYILNCDKITLIRTLGILLQYLSTNSHIIIIGT